MAVCTGGLQHVHCILFEKLGVKYSRTGNVQSILPVSKAVSVELDFIVVCCQTCLDMSRL